jgi:hypothetical protein
MKKCKFENLIDDYLLNRIDEREKEAFEEHYFNCSHCYSQMEEKNEMIAAIKAKGDEIFQNVYAPEKTKRTWLEPVLAFLTPRQWALAAVSAVLILVVAVGIIPHLKTGAPEFFVNDDLVRSSSITLISPATESLDRIPSEFRWQDLGENTEYKLFIYHQEELLWSTTTKENFVILSENIKSQMTSDKEYSWQVKAFSPEGTLIAVSSRVQFHFSPQK